MIDTESFEKILSHASVLSAKPSWPNLVGVVKSSWINWVGMVCITHTCGSWLLVSLQGKIKFCPLPPTRTPPFSFASVVQLYRLCRSQHYSWQQTKKLLSGSNYPISSESLIAFSIRFSPLASHLQFADDTSIFGGADSDNFFNVKVILLCFEAVLGLKVNFFKSELIGVLH